MGKARPGRALAAAADPATWRQAGPIFRPALHRGRPETAGGPRLGVRRLDIGESPGGACPTERGGPNRAGACHPAGEAPESPGTPDRGGGAQHLPGRLLDRPLCALRVPGEAPGDMAWRGEGLSRLAGPSLRDAAPAEHPPPRPGIPAPGYAGGWKESSHHPTRFCHLPRHMGSRQAVGASGRGTAHQRRGTWTDRQRAASLPVACPA
jgi:hypothetical protein